jgi:hypothetical protein
MESYLVDEINIHLKTKLDRIYQKYSFNISNQDIYDKYKINSLNIIPTIERPIKDHTKHSIAIKECRCEGRVWNKGIVEIVAGNYIYGGHCSRTKNRDSKYCGIHSRSEGHGNFFELPPHEHFKKYIIKHNLNLSD